MEVPNESRIFTDYSHACTIHVIKNYGICPFTWNRVPISVVSTGTSKNVYGCQGLYLIKSLSLIG